MALRCYIFSFIAQSLGEIDWGPESVKSNMEPPGEDFGALIDLVARGDLEAQDRLCRQYEPKLRIVARVLLGPALRPHLDTMDLVQSVHRSLLVGLRDQKFDVSSPEKLVGLASTIVRRKIARKWRRHRRQQRIGGAARESGSLADAINLLSSPDGGPEEVAQYKDQVEHLCNSLTETERRMLDMRLEGYTSAEVADALGIHAVALRVRWTRLRKRLDEAGVPSELL
ncbi:MAG: sigma-70 family RNA polymerase sigma factor [Planctomycetales bacterium]|nr:sigma-70 family RNA polymerase sigma factor [Planctomycetales bacterium]